MDHLDPDDRWQNNYKQVKQIITEHLPYNFPPLCFHMGKHKLTPHQNPKMPTAGLENDVRTRLTQRKPIEVLLNSSHLKWHAGW